MTRLPPSQAPCDIRPCPFCARVAAAHTYHGLGFDQWYVQCDHCECRTKAYDGIGAAIAQWNERQLPQESPRITMEATIDGQPAGRSEGEVSYEGYARVAFPRMDAGAGDVTGVALFHRDGVLTAELPIEPIRPPDEVARPNINRLVQNNATPSQIAAAVAVRESEWAEYERRAAARIAQGSPPPPGRNRASPIDWPSVNLRAEAPAQTFERVRLATEEVARALHDAAPSFVEAARGARALGEALQASGGVGGTETGRTTAGSPTARQTRPLQFGAGSLSFVRDGRLVELGEVRNLEFTTTDINPENLRALVQGNVPKSMTREKVANPPKDLHRRTVKLRSAKDAAGMEVQGEGLGTARKNGPRIRHRRKPGGVPPRSQQ